MIIDGRNLNYFGLTLLKINGPLDMPSRLGSTHHNWGDELEPLVHEDDLFWKSRLITCEFLFDGIRFNLTKEDLLFKLNALNNRAIFNRVNSEFKQRVISSGGTVVIDEIDDYFNLEIPSEIFYYPISKRDTDSLKGALLECDYGSFLVNIKQVQIVKSFSENLAIYKIVFEQKEPVFNGNLPQVTNSGRYRIDGVDLESMFVINKVTGLDHINTQTLNLTGFNSPKDISPFQSFRKLKISLTKVFENKQELKDDLESLNKILSQSGLRTIYIKGNIYQGFLTEGFKVKHSTGLAQFTLTLNII